ncbi:hypothetical protein JCM10296v2_006523 [Rhodotorula toruloides]
MPGSLATADANGMEAGTALIQADDRPTQLVRLSDLHRLLEEGSEAGKEGTVIVEFFQQATKFEDGEQVAYTPPDQECPLDEATLASLETRYPSLRIIPRILLPPGEELSSSLRFSLTPRWVVFQDGKYVVAKPKSGTSRVNALLQSYASGAPLPDSAKAIPLHPPRWYEKLALTEVQLFERYTFYLRLDWKRFLVLYLLTFVWLFRRQLFSL